MKSKISTSKVSFAIMCMLFVYMPLHYYICEIFFKDIKIDNILRDVVIIALFILVISGKQFKIKKIGVLICLNYVVLILFALESVLTSGSTRPLNILRTYLIPNLMFFICSQLEMNSERFSKLHRIIIVEFSIVAIYGFFQAFFLGDDFIIQLGYPSANGFLAGTSYYIGGFFGYQRSVGTFVSPNVCGVLLAIALCVLVFSNNYIDIKYKNIYLSMLGVGLLATFSRSSILGFILAWLFVYFILGKIQKINNRKLLKLMGVIFVVAICVVIVDKCFLNSLFMSMLESSLMGMINRTDTSTIKHIQDLVEPLQIIVKNPMGLGFGNNGPMALEVNPNANLVENSIYLMMYETGIVCGILFFFPYIWIIIKTFVNRKYRYYIPATVCIVVFTTYMLLPNVQTYEILFYSSVFIGLYYNSSIKELIVNSDASKKV